MDKKEKMELFQFILDGSVRKMVHCLVAEKEPKEDIVEFLQELQRKYQEVDPPESCIMAATPEKLNEIVGECQDYYERALESNPSIEDSVCKRSDYINKNKAVERLQQLVKNTYEEGKQYIQFKYCSDRKEKHG